MLGGAPLRRASSLVFLYGRLAVAFWEARAGVRALFVGARGARCGTGGGEMARWMGIFFAAERMSAERRL
jgi:hypothetical protein